MVKIDETFLKSVGLDGLPESRKQDFMLRAQEELETRVGERMSQGLTIDQLKEFEGIMKNDRETLVRMLAKVGDYRQDKIYQRLLEKHGVVEGTLEILGEYLSVKWIQMNRPDYATITESVAEEIRNEILGAKNEILATA
jgi:hypothetical protein